ncbi:MAG TPA: DUF5719 family protein [Actinomycetota bacterium]|nr:DUF5719 family protein [Actinomycetota bacterium]
MRARGQFLSAVLLVALVTMGAVYLQDMVGPRSEVTAATVLAPSGAWFCPHGGGEGWTTSLQVANPGTAPVQIRVTGIGTGKPSPPEELTVAPGTEVRVPAPAGQRASSTTVEYFGGWVAAGWLTHAGGGQSGVAAEPCLPHASGRWLLPDGSAERNQDDYLVVMNPFSAEAVFTVTLFTAKRPAPITPSEWTNVVLKPHRSQAFRLNPVALGEATVSALVQAKVGRVAASTLGLSDPGGVRSSVGVPGTPPTSSILPGAFDQGATDLVVMDPTERPAALQATVLGREGPQAIANLEDSSTNASSAVTYPVTTEGPSALVVPSPPGVAVARRTSGVASDQGSTTGAGTPAAAWVVLPAVAGSPSHPGMVLVNPADAPVHVTLSYLPADEGTVPAPVTLQVPPRSSVAAPKHFLEAKPMSAVLAAASDGTFVPAAASYSLGIRGVAGYAVSLGVAIPPAWVPR